MDDIADSGRFVCDVCGYRRTGLPNHCAHCDLAVCDRCWFSQGRGKGHELAEHGNEITFEELGYDPTVD